MNNTIRRPVNKQRKRDTVPPCKSTEATTVKSSHIVGTRRSATPIRMEGNVKNNARKPRRYMWNNISSFQYTTETRTNKEAVASPQRGRVRTSVQNRSWRPKLKKPCQEGISTVSTKRDPPHRPGQWHWQREIIRLWRPERQQAPLQRAHVKTTERKKALQRGKEPKSTCQAEWMGIGSNKASC